MSVRCFVASAFEKNDVDRVYDSVIRPIFANMKLPRPVRVDREEHNEDIDDRIFTHINNCDFCIADISYARPSVYYEAGYASGLGKEVIYIVRKDHFIERPESDPHGNYRVHFDLKMKNIIPWDNKNLEPFKRALSRRISAVIKRIRSKAKQRERPLEEEREFLALSISERESLLAKSSITMIRKFGYRKGAFQYHPFTPGIRHYTRVSPKGIEDFFIIDGFHLTKKGLSFASSKILSWLREAARTSNVNLVFVSLDKIRSSTLLNTFYDWRPVNNRSLERIKDNCIMGITVIDDVRSRADFCKRLRGLLLSL